MVSPYLPLVYYTTEMADLKIRNLIPTYVKVKISNTYPAANLTKFKAQNLCIKNIFKILHKEKQKLNDLYEFIHD